MVGVLVLDASYGPIHIVDHHRALTLLFGDKVDVVAPSQRVVASAHRQIVLPSIIRLRRYVNVPQRGATWTRHAVLVRDHFACCYCGVKLSEREATIDHVVPQWLCKSTGQPANTWTNTVTACRACQARKGGRSMHETGMKFFDPGFEPRRPRTRYWVLSSEIAPEWKQYVEI